jgi:hypothetical protein
MDAITGLSDYITNVDLVDYMWFKNFSDNSYTLCYIRSDAGCRESDHSRQHNITLRLRYTILHGKTPKLSLGSLPIFDSLNL